MSCTISDGTNTWTVDLTRDQVEGLIVAIRCGTVTLDVAENPATPMPRKAGSGPARWEVEPF